MSPPYGGPVITLSEVVHGGCSSYETSECQRSSLENALGSGRREPSLNTTGNKEPKRDMSEGARTARERGGARHGRTVDFLETGLPRNGRRCMLVKGPEMARKFELFVDADFLVAEDWWVGDRSGS